MLSPAAVAVVVIVILVANAVIIIVPLTVVIMLAMIQLLLSVLVLRLVISIVSRLVLGILSAELIGLRITVGGSPACGMGLRGISPTPLVGGRVYSWVSSFFRRRWGIAALISGSRVTMTSISVPCY